MAKQSKTQKTVKPFGTWRSPISPDLIAAAIRVGEPQWDTDGKTLLWLEGRSGRGVVVAQPLGEAPYDLTGDMNVRGGVGYGGGDYSVRNGVVVFAEKNGRLYRRELGYGFSRSITPAFGGVASPQLSPDGHWVVFVHTYEGRDVLGLVDSLGRTWPVKLVEGADFYMQPVWHPSGKTLAWVEWDHPNMPWDGTRLMLADLAGEQPGVGSSQLIAGGPEVAILQPAFSPDGRYLSFVQNEGEWDQLVLFDLADGSLKLLVEDASLLKPAWVQGVVVQAWTPDSKQIVFLQMGDGKAGLKRVNVQTGQVETVDLPAYTMLSHPTVSTEGRLALAANGPTVSTRIISMVGETETIHQRSTSEAIPPEDLPQAYEIKWQTDDGEMAYGIFYPPTSSHYTGTGLPPAIVYIHGGPTSSSSVRLCMEAAFFTSRGYGYLEVNYRGSTGFGRKYRDALKGKWGEIDVVDAVGGAQALIDQGLADPGRLVIKGGSAGGYTVLNALIRYPGMFKAGLCSYGVSNLFTLAMDTHKFEERYNDSLVGPLPEAAEKYREWSPMFQADKIKDPVAVFQGEEDRVVPPSQSEEIVQALKANGVPHEYHLYPGEGHGFRKMETLREFYRAIERFLTQYVIFG